MFKAIKVRIYPNKNQEEKGSKNKEKARIKLARAHQKIKNYKINYYHHITNQLISENQTIAIENLDVKGMIENRNPNDTNKIAAEKSKARQEVSFGELTRMLKYKGDWSNRNVIEVSRWFPSTKLCFNCGFENDKLSLRDRFWECPECGEVHDRDFNASKNIRDEGIRLLKIKYPPIKGILSLWSENNSFHSELGREKCIV